MNIAVTTKPRENTAMDHSFDNRPKNMARRGIHDDNGRRCRRRSPFCTKSYLDRVHRKIDRSVSSDGDIWVEKTYQARGKPISYFLSSRGFVQLLNAPTGAGIVVYCEQIYKNDASIQSNEYCYHRVVQHLSELKLLRSELLQIPLPRMSMGLSPTPLREIHVDRKDGRFVMVPACERANAKGPLWYKTRHVWKDILQELNSRSAASVESSEHSSGSGPEYSA